MTPAKRPPGPTPLGEAIRLRLRALREDREWTREELAALARSHGLEWTHDTVKNIEAGTRDLAVPELLVLLLVFGMSAETFLGEESPPLELSPMWTVEPQELAQVVSGTLRRDAHVTPPTVPAAATVPRVRVVERRASLSASGSITVGQAAGLADQKAAAALGVSVEKLEAAAMRAWGRSLTAERERRLEDRLADRRVTPRSRQAIRGHFTRELPEELRDRTGKKG